MSSSTSHIEKEERNLSQLLVLNFLANLVRAKMPLCVLSTYNLTLSARQLRGHLWQIYLIKFHNLLITELSCLSLQKSLRILYSTVYRWKRMHIQNKQYWQVVTPDKKDPKSHIYIHKEKGQVNKCWYMQNPK